MDGNSVGVFTFSKSRQNQFSKVFSADYEYKALQEYLEKSCVDAVNQRFLSGEYNPFIRTYPFPPVHINLNYLIDPRAVAFGRVYDKLYDEHTEGAALNRAEGLVIPGVSQVVFHPNRHPIAKDDVPWWKTVVDFYFGDGNNSDED